MQEYFRRYYAFLKRSVTTLPHDIVQPYHKITDFILKLHGLLFATLGSYFVLSSSFCFFSAETAFCSEIANSFKPSLLLVATGFDSFFIRWIVGVGFLIIAIFISTVLLVRHLNETLPDHIYLRCFSTDEEKARRLPQKN